MHNKINQQAGINTKTLKPFEAIAKATIESATSKIF